MQSAIAKIDRILSRLDLFETEAHVAAEQFHDLNGDSKQALLNAQVLSKPNGVLPIAEQSARNSSETSLRWRLDSQIYLSLDYLNTLLVTPDLVADLIRQIYEAIGVTVTSTDFKLLPYSDGEVRLWAPVRSFILKVTLHSDPIPTATALIPVFVSVGGPHEISVRSAGTARLIGLPRSATNLSQQLQSAIKEVMETIFAAPVPINFENPVDHTRFLIGDSLVQTNGLSITSQSTLPRYAHKELPYVIFQIYICYISFELLPRYFVPLFDHMISGIDKSVISMPAGYTLDELYVTRLSDYIMVGTLSVQFRISGVILSSLCRHEFSGDYTFNVENAPAQPNKLRVQLTKLFVENGSVKSKSRGEFDNPICHIENSAIANYLLSLSDILIIDQTIPFSRAEFAVYPPFMKGQNLSIRFFE